VTHKSTLTQKQKFARVGFQCESEFKMRIDVALAQRQLTFKDAATEALAKFLKIAPPQSPEVAA
jgi:hypothetical protein